MAHHPGEPRVLRPGSALTTRRIVAGSVRDPSGWTTSVDDAPMVPAQPGVEMPVSEQLDHRFTMVMAFTAEVLDADAVSLTFTGDTAAGSRHADHRLARCAEDQQRALDEGPGLTAVHTATVVTGQNISLEQRWPRWTREARKLKIGAVLAAPLPDEQRDHRPEFVGSITAYYLWPRTFSAADIRRAEATARCGAELVTATVRQHHLELAVQTRTTIGQAQGILMERWRLSPEAAIAALRTYSQQHNVKLNAAAADLARTGTLPDLDRGFLDRVIPTMR